MRPTFEYYSLNMEEFQNICMLNEMCDIGPFKDRYATVMSVEKALKCGIINMQPRMYKALTGCKKREVFVLLQCDGSMVQVLTYGDVMPEINKLLNCKYKSECLNAGIRASDTAFDLPLLAILDTGKDKVMRWMVGVLSRNPVTGGCILHEYRLTKEEKIDGGNL